MKGQPSQPPCAPSMPSSTFVLTKEPAELAWETHASLLKPDVVSAPAKEGKRRRPGNGRRWYFWVREERANGGLRLGGGGIRNACQNLMPTSGSGSLYLYQLNSRSK